MKEEEAAKDDTAEVTEQLEGANIDEGSLHVEFLDIVIIFIPVFFRKPYFRLFHLNVPICQIPHFSNENKIHFLVRFDTFQLI